MQQIDLRLLLGKQINDILCAVFIRSRLLKHTLEKIYCFFGKKRLLSCLLLFRNCPFLILLRFPPVVISQSFRLNCAITLLNGQPLVFLRQQPIPLGHPLCLDCPDGQHREYCRADDADRCIYPHLPYLLRINSRLNVLALHLE